MRTLSIISLTGILVFSAVASKGQEEIASVATLHLADGTSVALIEWKLTYEFLAWKAKEPVSSAKPQVRENAMLILGKKSYSVRGDTLALTHEGMDDTVRVASVNLGKVGDLKLEPPAWERVATDVEKGYIYKPRSLDIAGKTLSGIERSFCIASFSVLVECGGTKTTRVVKIDFN